MCTIFCDSFLLCFINCAGGRAASLIAWEDAAATRSHKRACRARTARESRLSSTVYSQPRAKMRMLGVALVLLYSVLSSRCVEESDVNARKLRVQ